MSFEWRRYMKLSRVILIGLNMGYLTTKRFDRTLGWSWYVNHNNFILHINFLWCVPSLEMSNKRGKLCWFQENLAQHTYLEII